MSATFIVILICVLMLMGYLFEISSQKTKIPTVIIMMLIGWLVRQGLTYFEFSIPDLLPLLSVIGSIGLILIVLEGSLELEIDRNKKSMITKSLFVAVMPVLFFIFTLTAYINFQYGYRIHHILLNAVPLAVISSAIAIPSVMNLANRQKEFVIYESSLSDITGVLLFNFIAQHEILNRGAIFSFFGDIGLILLISAVSSLFLSYLISKINHTIKFGPIIILIILIYFISKVYHLPGLLFIMILGIFLSNLHRLDKWKFIHLLNPNILDVEVHKLRENVIEAAFLVRSVFFVLFGFMMDTQDIIDIKTLPWTLGIMTLIYFLRIAHLNIIKEKINPIAFIAPRGLITILLFLSISDEMRIPLISKPLLIQLVLGTTFVMMIAMLLNKDGAKKPNHQPSKISSDGS